eukprot:249809-Prorocentrum_lima.AAC.1
MVTQGMHEANHGQTRAKGTLCRMHAWQSTYEHPSTGLPAAVVASKADTVPATLLADIFCML